jgi:hypothetical protein
LVFCFVRGDIPYFATTIRTENDFIFIQAVDDMIHADLLKACESGFASIRSDRKAAGIEISSGGNDVPGDEQLRTEPACLYATEGLAYLAWLAEFNRSIDREGKTLVWVDRPYVETYRITLGDSYGTYRVVRDRYVVRGTVAVEDFVPEVTEEVKPKRKTKAA